MNNYFLPWIFDEKSCSWFKIKSDLCCTRTLIIYLNDLYFVLVQMFMFLHYAEKFHINFLWNMELWHVCLYVISIRFWNICSVDKHWILYWAYNILEIYERNCSSSLIHFVKRLFLWVWNNSSFKDCNNEITKALKKLSYKVQIISMLKL